MATAGAVLKVAGAVAVTTLSIAAALMLAIDPALVALVEEDDGRILVVKVAVWW